MIEGLGVRDYIQVPIRIWLRLQYCGPPRSLRPNKINFNYELDLAGVSREKEIYYMSNASFGG